jgi:hypothetical protein
MDGYTKSFSVLVSLVEYQKIELFPPQSGSLREQVNTLVIWLDTQL